MASGLKRRWSKELPPDLSDLMNKLIENAASFIKQFGISEQRMGEIANEFESLSEEIKEMQKATDRQRKHGAITGGIGSLLFVSALSAAPFTGGLSFAASVAAFGGVTAVAGGAVVVVHANLTKIMSERGGAKKIETWGKEFMAMVEPMNKNLEEINMASEKLEEISAKAQAENTLTNVDEFQRILKKVSELKEKSKGVVIESMSVLDAMGEVVMLIGSIIRLTPTPEQDEKLGNAIIQSADQCQKVVKEIDEMKKKLIEFTGCKSVEMSSTPPPPPPTL